MAPDGRRGLQEVLRGHTPERDDEPGLDDVELLEQIGNAGLHFVRLGVAIVRRTALENVGDVDVLALEVDGLEDLVQQLAHRADEGLALEILVAARGLAHQHQCRVGIAHPEDGVRAPAVEFALRAAFDASRVELGERDGALARRRHGDWNRQARCRKVHVIDTLVPALSHPGLQIRQDGLQLWIQARSLALCGSRARSRILRARSVLSIGPIHSEWPAASNR